MRNSKDVEKIVRDGKPNVKTGNQLDKLIIEGSHSIMDESKLLFPKSNLLMLLVRHKIAVCVTSIVIIVTVGLLMFQSEPENNIEPLKITNLTQTPADLTTIVSLNFAYRYGGMEMVGEQFDKALQKAGQKPADISMQEFYENIKN